MTTPFSQDIKLDVTITKSSQIWGHVRDWRGHIVRKICKIVISSLDGSQTYAITESNPVDGSFSSRISISTGSSVLLTCFYEGTFRGQYNLAGSLILTTGSSSSFSSSSSRSSSSSSLSMSSSSSSKSSSSRSSSSSSRSSSSSSLSSSSKSSSSSSSSSRSSSSSSRSSSSSSSSSRSSSSSSSSLSSISSSSSSRSSSSSSSFSSSRSSSSSSRSSSSSSRSSSSSSYTAPTEYWNPGDKSANITLSNGDQDAAAANTSWKSCKSYDSYNTGKHYFEIEIITAADNFNIIGVGTLAELNSTYVGGTANDCGYGYRGTDGNKVTKEFGFQAYGDGFTTGDIVGVALDLDNGEIYFAKNNTWQNSSNPVTRTNPAYTSISGTFYAMCSPYTNTNKGRIFTQIGEFNYTPPTGFSAWH